MAVIDFLYLLVLIPTFPWWIRYLFLPRYRHLIRRRFFPDLLSHPGKSVWIHSVSVGEARSVRGLIQELQNLGKRVVLSVTTPAGFEYACKEYTDIPVIPAPVDFSFVIRKFLKRINPELIVFNELELWPNWIYVAKRLQIPLLLINGRISDQAFRQYIYFSRLTGRFLNRLDGVIAQSERYRNRFLQLKIPEDRVKVCGNIKADEAWERASVLPPQEEIRSQLGLRDESRRIVVVASSHREDEHLVIPGIKRADDFFFIIVPRHPERTPEITSLLQEEGIPYRLFSDPPSPSQKFRVLLVDRIGLLFEIISIADMVWMGGTCSRRVGGHNLYEPAILGKPIFGGRHYENFHDIGADLEAVGVYQRIEHVGEFLNALNRLEKMNKPDIREKAIEEVRIRRGSVECTVKQIQQLCGF